MINEKIVDKIVEQLAGTSNSWCAASEDAGIEIEAIEEIMLNANYERCPECDWWVECSELLDDNGELTVCENCRPPAEE